MSSRTNRLREARSASSGASSFHLVSHYQLVSDFCRRNIINSFNHDFQQHSIPPSPSCSSSNPSTLHSKLSQLCVINPNRFHSSSLLLLLLPDSVLNLIKNRRRFSNLLLLYRSPFDVYFPFSSFLYYSPFPLRCVSATLVFPKPVQSQTKPNHPKKSYLLQKSFLHLLFVSSPRSLPCFSVP